MALLEICASPKSPLSQAVIALGGRASRVGLPAGDILNPRVFDWIAEVIELHRPRHVWASPSCGPFSALLNLIKHKAPSKERAANYETGVRLLEAACRLLEIAHRFGCCIHFEHPLSATSWSRQVLERLPGQRASLAQCRYGARHPISNRLVLKRTGIKTTSRRVFEAMNLKCLCDAVHDRIIGGRHITRPLEIYPHRMCQTLAKIFVDPKSSHDLIYQAAFARFKSFR